MILKSSEKTDVNMTELVATVDAETFEKAIEAVYQQQKKNISLPGFRKGKVPRRLCERTYGEGVFFAGCHCRSCSESGRCSEGRSDFC